MKINETGTAAKCKNISDTCLRSYMLSSLAFYNTCFQGNKLCYNHLLRKINNEQKS